MKLDVAVDDAVVDDSMLEVAVVDPNAWKWRVGLAGVVLGMCTMLAGAASALDGIDLSQPAEAAAAGECPQLIQIKYPFLSCVNGQIGQSDADETWENSRRIPMGSVFIEGDGFFGPDLNSD